MKTLLLLLALTASKKHVPATIVLNGNKTDVTWSDGDSFKIKSGVYKGRGTRMQGYNTLEAFGPVHRWGQWSPRELYQLALDAAPAAASQEWTCTTDGTAGGYGRLLIHCPELVKHMVAEGWAMVYAVDGTQPDPGVLELQKKAIEAKAGMWKKGAVKGVITSLHSADEDGGKEPAVYNRVVDTRTGAALKREHHQTYRPCQEVCEETDGERSCMVYVPFEHRYKDKPECLR